MDDYLRFLAVAEHRNISRAAEALNISQPALSRTIRLLEDRYGTPLFERTPQGVELSDAGKTLYIYASRAVRALKNAREDIDHSLHQTRLILPICSGDSWGYGILPHVIESYRRENPEVSIHLDVIEHDARMRGLETRRHDVAFGVISPEYLEGGAYSFEPIICAKYDIYCDASHPLLRQQRITEADLLAESWINHKFEYDYDPSSALRSRRRYVLRTNALVPAIEALRGSRLLISTAKTLGALFARSGIVRLTEDGESPDFVSGVISQQSAPLRPHTRRFIAAVRAYCQAQGFRADAKS
ncbi:LysR family transcriptional regulator [Paracoccus sp. pheM1]|uniref:LysR family transcriptional regulator n=1 Tax=Paracoccus sp. pheM1 TaxID=2831675 RepID=UPI00091B7C2B|nr:LysR family transcriptional regulator [Paracoccus sp. pheM1]MBT0779207.1 LysR family transcriptional regulator [Paracoccus sp. pheM1]SFX97734.1 DNA-binding transcriptional regulator, LysR family [Paracoccus pantotrophus]